MTERQLRRQLAGKGYLLRKSRAGENADNFGGYQIIDAAGGYIVAGFRFNLDLDDVAEFLKSDK